MKKIIALLAFTVFSTTAHSDPCAGVTRAISKSKKASIESVMAKKLKTESAVIFEYMEAGGWKLIWVDTNDSEPGVFFFHENPLSGKYVTVWGGAATYGEESQVISWANANAPGIPANLSSCFAWRVSPEGREQAGK